MAEVWVQPTQQLPQLIPRTTPGPCGASRYGNPKLPSRAALPWSLRVQGQDAADASTIDLPSAANAIDTYWLQACMHGHKSTRVCTHEHRQRSERQSCSTIRQQTPPGSFRSAAGLCCPTRFPPCCSHNTCTCVVLTDTAPSTLSAYIKAYHHAACTMRHGLCTMYGTAPQVTAQHAALHCTGKRT